LAPDSLRVVSLPSRPIHHSLSESFSPTEHPMPNASRAIPLFVLISILASCSAGGDKSSSSTPTGTTSIYTGAFANATRSGTIAVSIISSSAPALLALPTGINAQSTSAVGTASATMVFTDGTSTTLSGNYTASTGALSLSGNGGFSLSGTLSAGTLRGTVTSGGGTGSFVAYTSTAGSSAKVLCGTYGGSDAGFWNIVISPTGTVSGGAASIRGARTLTFNGTLSGSTITFTTSDNGSATGTLSADGLSITGTWSGNPGESGTFQGSTGICGTPTPGTVPAAVTPNVSGSWVTPTSSSTHAWVAILQVGSALSGAGVLTTPAIIPISGPSTPVYTGDAFTITSGTFSGSSVTFTASVGNNPAGNGTFFHGSLTFRGTLSGTNTMTGTLNFTPTPNLSQTFGAQTLTGFTFTKQ
jgi:hypothetical protein